jgi:hypothetical protein
LAVASFTAAPLYTNHTHAVQVDLTDMIGVLSRENMIAIEKLDGHMALNFAQNMNAERYLLQQVASIKFDVLKDAFANAEKTGTSLFLLKHIEYLFKLFKYYFNNNK